MGRERAVAFDPARIIIIDQFSTGRSRLARTCAGWKSWCIRYREREPVIGIGLLCGGTEDQEPAAVLNKPSIRDEDARSAGSRFVYFALPKPVGMIRQVNWPRKNGAASICGVTSSQTAPQSSMYREKCCGVSQTNPTRQLSLIL